MTSVIPITPDNYAQVAVDLVGILGNAVLLVQLSRYPVGSRLSTSLLKSQCVADLLICTVSAMLLLRIGVQNTGVLWWDTFVCHFYISQALFWTSVSYGVSNLMCIALDRYWAVNRATQYRALEKRHGIYCGFLMFFYVGYRGVTQFLKADFSSGTCLSVTFIKTPEATYFYRYNSLNLMVTVYLVPTGLCLLLYTKVILCIRSSGRRIAAHSANNAHSNDHQLKRTARHLTLSTAIMMLLFILCLGPNSILFPLNMLGVPVYFMDSPLQRLGAFLVSVNSVLNPFVLYTFMRRMRSDFLRLVKCSATARGIANHETANSQETVQSAKGK